MKTLEISTNPETGFQNIEKDISKQIEKLKKFPVIEKILAMLEGLPEDLTYHNKKHTEDVLHEAMMFATVDGLTEPEKEKLAVAAVLHDAGYLFTNKNYEQEIVKFIDEKLSREEFDSLNIEDIKKMILDTEIKMTENGPSIIMDYPGSAYLLDADVSDFGRTDFKEKSDLIEKELKIDPKDKEARLKFLKSTLLLMQNHEWHTPAAEKLRQKQKLINMKELEKEIADLQN